MPWKMQEISDSGVVAEVEGGYNLPWWFPRLAKQGIPNGVNYHNHNYSGTSVTAVTIIDDHTAHLARLLMTQIMLDHATQTFPNCNNSNAQGITINYHLSDTDGYLYFLISAVGPTENAFQLQSGIDILHDWNFRVSTGVTTDFGYIEINTAASASGVSSDTYIQPALQLTPGVYTHALAFSVAVSAMFCRSEFFGYGSLMESMGHHMFSEVRLFDALITYVGLSSKVLVPAYASSSSLRRYIFAP